MRKFFASALLAVFGIGSASVVLADNNPYPLPPQLTDNNPYPLPPQLTDNNPYPLPPQ